MPTFERKPRLPAVVPAVPKAVSTARKPPASAEAPVTAAETRGADFSRIPATAQVQRKASVGTPTDTLEREADAAAEQVTRSAEPAAASRIAEPETAPAAPAAERKGQALPGELRAYFEPRFGQGFGGVRLHTDGAAAGAARALQARAYTVGRDIVFGAGEYRPGTGDGKRLLAHELAHVVQQRSMSGDALQRKEAPGATGGGKAPDPTERLAGTLWAKSPDGKDLPPSLEDLSQGGLADCFLFAAMGAIVNTNPQRIVNMIKDNADGSYTVTFKGIGFFSSATQTVTADFAKGKHGNVKARQALWPLIIEKAYAQQKGGIEAISKGGLVGEAIKDLTNDGPSWFDPRQKTADYIMGKLAKAKEKKWPMTIGSPKKEDASKEKQAMADGVKGLYFWHRYVVLDIDVEKNRIKLFNPWGKDHPNGDGWIEVEQARKFFVSITIND